MKKIIWASIASLYLGCGLGNIIANVYGDKSQQNLEAIASEVAPVEDISENEIFNRSIAEKYSFVEEDEIYYMVDKALKERRGKIPKYLDRDFFRGVVFIESSDNPRALSSAGARGLMQLTLDAWRQIRPELDYIRNVYSPRINIPAGIDYFIWLDNYCSQNNPEWALLSDDEKRNIVSASYNGGIGRLSNSDWDISQMSQETQDYVIKIDKIINS